MSVARVRDTKGSGLILLCALLFTNPGIARSQDSYSWRDIDCAKSRIVAWRGLSCRESGVTTNQGRAAAFRQWSAFGSNPAGFYVHMFLAEAVNGASLDGDDAMADFVTWMFENGKRISGVSAVQRAAHADYVTFRDDRIGRRCAGFRRLGDFRRHGYASLTGGILCAPPGTSLTEDDVELFIDNVKLQPAATAAVSR